MIRFKRPLLAGFMLPAICVAWPAYAQSTSASDNAAATRASGNAATNADNGAWSRNGMEESWNALDTNHDGVISRAEFNAADSGRADRMRPLSDTQTGNRNAGSNGRALTHVRHIRVTNLIGTDVKNPQGEDLGQIKDLLVDVRNARVRYAVLDYGGVAGKLFSVPITAFRPSANNRELVVNIDNSRLENAPGFDAEQWPDFNESAYTGQVDRYFGNGMRGQGVSSDSASRAGSSAGGALRRASRLIGRDVNDRQGEDIGQIDDLVVDMRSGNIRYAVLEYDKRSSTDNEMWAVPMSALDFVKGRNIKLDVNRAQMDTGPSFGSERVRDVNGRPVAIERYWLVVVPGDVNGSRENGTRGSDTSGSSANDSANGAGAHASSAQEDGAGTSVGNTSANGAGGAAAWTATDDNHPTSGSSSTTGASEAQSGSSVTTGSGSDTSATSTPSSSAEFDRLDTNRDGNLSSGELAQDPAESAKFQEFDKNGNGAISREEFKPERRLPAASNEGSNNQ
jgi:sporulation protein YlmC with PRC-barrel domain